MQSENAASKLDAPTKATNLYREGRPATCNLQPDDSRSSLCYVATAAAVFLAILLIMNRDLFTVPIMEYWDFAANAIQIERAKHFRELLGNYSRFRFHHPGPGFFYIFALGEWLFHDLLHLVPSEMNSHILTIILLNTAFLFGAIALLAKRCRSRLFPPMALLVSLFFIYVVNRTIPGSAVLSVWMPHVIMFCFFFFVTVCASVAMGEVSKLPLLVFSGLLLIHGHAAQLLFVAPLSILAFATVWWRDGKPIGLPRFLGENRTPVAVSVGLLVVFSIPILLDVALHRPNNIQTLLAYTSRYKGIQNSPMLSLKYEASFLAFVASPEIVLQAKSAQLISKGGSKPYVVLYWCFAWLMIGLVAGIYAKQREPRPPFFTYIAVEIAAVLLLFYYWALKMAPPLFNFNGYFVYCVQLLTLLAMVALILDGLNITVRSGVAFALCTLLPISMFAAKPGFINAETGDAETNRLIASLPPNVGEVHFTFQTEDWLTIVGVASRMKHEHRPFCVDDVWGFTFGQDNLCHSMSGLTNLVLTRSPGKCEAPCRVLLKDDQFEFQLSPYSKAAVANRSLTSSSDSSIGTLTAHFHISSVAEIDNLLSGHFDRVDGNQIEHLNDPKLAMRVAAPLGCIVEGWVASGDFATARPMDEVYAVVDGVLVKAQIVPRPDVVEHWKNPALNNSGYRVYLDSTVLRPEVQAVELIGYIREEKKLYRFPGTLYLESR